MRLAPHLRALIAGSLVFSSALFAQNPTVAFPQNYKLVLDNADVAVLRAHYGPHESVGVHDHSAFSTVYVYLNDSGPVLFQHEEAGPFDQTRPPTHVGAFRVSPGRLERHSVKNLSDTPSDYLRIELKKLPVHALPAEFRGPAPTPPFVPGTTVAYDNPALKVERIVCASTVVCEVPPDDAPSVLVAIASAPVAVGKSGQKLTFDEPVAWLPAHAKLELQPTGVGTFQVLRVVLLKH